MIQEQVILVDENDTEIGKMEKMEAHEKACLHRAFSGFVLNDKRELLLQQRAFDKYHNPGIWSNTVCSHPRPSETTLAAVERRLLEELGFQVPFTEVGAFAYRATFSNGLTEHEYDHVFVAQYNGQPIIPNADEVADYRWISKNDLLNEVQKDPVRFSFWMRTILESHVLDAWF